MALAIANSALSIGSAFYFYKQLESERLNIIKISQTISGLVKKVTEMEKSDQNRGEAIHTLNDQVNNIKRQVEEGSLSDLLEDLDIDIDEIVTVLDEHEIPVERPSKMTRPRRSGDRRNPPSRREEMEERRVESSTPRRISTSKPTESRYSRREVRPNGSRNEARVRPSAGYEDDDDSTLIETFRRQQVS